MFKTKKKWSSKYYGILLGKKFVRKIVRFSKSEYFGMIIEQLNIINQKSFFKEWFCFEMFIMFQSLNTYYHDKKYIYEVIDSFHDVCSKFFIRYKFSESSVHFTEFYLNRYKKYSFALNKNSNSRPYHKFSEIVLSFLSSNTTINSHRIFIATYYIEEISSHLKLLKRLMKKIKIIE